MDATRLVDEYHDAQDRIVGLIEALSPGDEEATVPACPAPTVEADLAAHGLGAVHLVGGDRDWTFGEGDVGLEVRASMFELFRLMGGRRSRAQMLATEHDGDLAAHLDALVHLDPPTEALVD